VHPIDGVRRRQSGQLQGRWRDVAQILERIEQQPDVMIGVLEISGVDLHLPCQHELHLGVDVIPGRDPCTALGQVAVSRDHYDAEYVALAQALSAPLLTTDQRMAQPAAGAQVAT
jgi:hypothetical protein